MRYQERAIDRRTGHLQQWAMQHPRARTVLALRAAELARGAASPISIYNRVRFSPFQQVACLYKRFKLTVIRAYVITARSAPPNDAYAARN